LDISEPAEQMAAHSQQETTTMPAEYSSFASLRLTITFVPSRPDVLVSKRYTFTFVSKVAVVECGVRG
jgi:hypothetical protein